MSRCICRRRTAVLALILASISVTSGVLFSYSLTGPQEQTSPGANIVLISWDGVQRNHFFELLRNGALPNIAALSWEGGIVNVTVTDHVTDTKAGHSEMLTGYGPEITGVFSNRKFNPIPRGYTVFERVEYYFGKDAIATIMVTGKTHNLGGERGEPFYNARFALDVFDSNAASAGIVGPKAIRYLNDHMGMRFFAFFHFSDPDSSGHKFGENSREYGQAIVTCDFWLGKIVENLKERGVYASTAILVTSDHGFDENEKSHRDAPFVFVASNRPLRGNGNQKDIVPTILSLIEVNPIQFKPRLPGASLAMLQSHQNPSSPSALHDLATASNISEYMETLQRLGC